MQMIRKIIGWWAMIVMAAPCAATAQSGDGIPIDSEKKTLNVRLVALGHRRLAKFQRSDKERIVKIQTPDGETVEENIPAGVPIEIKGKAFEYLPPLVYIKERGLKNGKKHVIAPLVLNSATAYKKLSLRSSVGLLLKQPPEEKEGRPTFRNYATASVAENQSHMIMALINRHKKVEGWAQPLLKTFDVSPSKLPGGSILFFNSTPFPMEVDLLLEGEYQTVMIQPMTSRQYAPRADKNGRSLLRAKIVARNGAKKQIYYNTVKVNDTGRTFLFAYYDPRMKTSNPAGIVQFADELPAVNPVE